MKRKHQKMMWRTTEDAVNAKRAARELTNRLLATKQDHNTKEQALRQNSCAVSNVAANTESSAEKSKTRLDKLKLKVVTLQANVKK